MNVGESAEAAALRELKEETKLSVPFLKQLHVFSDPKRDPRRCKYKVTDQSLICSGRHTVSVCFVGRVAEGHDTKETAAMLAAISAGDDAKAIVVVKVEDVRQGRVTMAFDHGSILNKYLEVYHPEH